MSTDQPTASSVHAEYARAATARVNVALPATIVTYDRTTQKASVQIVTAFRRRNAEGEPEAYRPPVIPGVPVAWWGGGDFSFTCPLEEGDSGLLVFCDRSMDEWLSTGEATTEPQDLRRHSLNDAVFLPGLRSFARALDTDAVSATAAVLKADALVVNAADIKLGSSAATSAVALGPLVDAQLSALQTALAAWVPVAGDGGAALKALLTTLIGTGWPAATGATKVKAE